MWQPHWDRRATHLMQSVLMTYVKNLALCLSSIRQNRRWWSLDFRWWQYYWEYYVNPIGMSFGLRMRRKIRRWFFIQWWWSYLLFSSYFCGASGSSGWFPTLPLLNSKLPFIIIMTSIINPYHFWSISHHSTLLFSTFDPRTSFMYF